jgi:UPF0176 protein
VEDLSLTTVTYTIAAFYRFISVSEPTALAEKLRTVFCEGDLCGTMLIADEGVNGTMAGSPETIDHFLDMLAEEVGLERGEVKLSFSGKRPFKRQKFQVKPEIITFRKAKVDPTNPGKYVEAQEWNGLIAQTGILLLDTRNSYETDLGTFDGATVPGIETFSDFVTYVRENLDATKHPKVAMFCTGGIRCEKASAFMLQEGFEEVYHLKGGVLKYLEQVPEHDSKWRGGCYVFDRRISVSHEDFES